MSARTLKNKVAVIAGGGKNLGALIGHQMVERLRFLHDQAP